ncbi:chemotaxis protein CheD [Alteribacillus persepolensis]|uniref:Probable chemoreceptor glutamine deamidase CheD n=1 Tax=Alteribacillus persepolensis TaxID=568899 RepID=A0A1G7YPU5_9BACI|nr:chemotaxis protein CheD [Alteribacillus persepolensis]SDG98612.1 chemotaxis protein CheD [Alteribacillus persepolensis]
MNQTNARLITVGMAEWKHTKAPSCLRTCGLGSCVGIVLYEEQQKVAALAHIMLPDSSLARNKAIKRSKFADTAVEDMITYFIKSGCLKRRIKAKIAGGAQMFSVSTSHNVMKIGARNIVAVEAVLKQHSIPVIARDVGGHKGRTITFHVSSSDLHVKTLQQGEAVI